jgi:putative DNA modification/repair radical SAM protein
MSVRDKLGILADSAKYDVSCASSGSSGRGQSSAFSSAKSYGKAMPGGICHTWTSDGRCVSLLKVLLSNSCIYDCAYCVNRRSIDRPRTTFKAKELADLVEEFYRRNYIEGLFLSSGIIKSPDYTMEQMLYCVRLLRQGGFGGYIHLKAIPGASPELLREGGFLADRMSANIELPTQQSLTTLAPDKTKRAILGSMFHLRQAADEIDDANKSLKIKQTFVPSGQSTQMIIGASPENDAVILRLSAALYQTYGLKRVYYSAYMPSTLDNRLPFIEKPPLQREHRLYQADWLYRFYGFDMEEIIPGDNLELTLDPKAFWAARHPEFFPVDVMTAAKADLLRVPGIGPTGAERIIAARRFGTLSAYNLKKIGIVLKRAEGFLLSGGRPLGDRLLAADEKLILQHMQSREYQYYFNF